MDDDNDNDDLDLTESDESSSSSNEELFDAVNPYVFEVNELKKDWPDSENAKRAQGVKKTKKFKKRRNKLAKLRVVTSSSGSSSVPVALQESKEKFYDANESNPAPDQQTIPVTENGTDVSMVTVRPNLEANPKTLAVQTPLENTPAPQKQYALTKPVYLPK